MNITFKRALICALAALSPLLRIASCSAQEGSFDPTFGIGGTQIVNVSVLGTSDQSARLILRSDGKLLMGGSCLYQLLDIQEPTICLTQLLADGTYDGNFGPGGVGYLEFDHFAGWPSITGLIDMIVLRDGRIAVLGNDDTDSSNQKVLLAVLRADGSALDSTVAGTGYFPFQFNAASSSGSASSLLQQPDDKVLVAGAAVGVNANTDFAVGRLLADLSGFDTSFGSGGSQTVAFDLGGPGGDNTDACTAVRLQSDGKIVLVGYSFTSPAGQPVSGAEISVSRLNADGTRDLTFGSSGDGRVHYSAGNPIALALDARIDASDRIVVGGLVATSSTLTGSQWLIDRLSPNGGRDTTFDQGNPQIFFQPPGNAGFAGRLALTNDGIFAIGVTPRAPAATTHYFAVARLNAYGLLDARFGNGGLQYGGFRGNDVDTLNPDIAVGNGGVMVSGTQEQNNGTGGHNYKFAIGRLQYDQIFSDGFGGVDVSPAFPSSRGL